MINLWNRVRNKPVVLNFYTDRPEMMRYSRPVKTKRTFPKWWKAVPKTIHQPLGTQPTMKGCVGFTDLFQSGIVLPMWSDLDVEVGAKGQPYASWRHADVLSIVESHPQAQRGEYLPETDYQHLKLSNPWFAECDEDIKWAFIPTTWNFGQPEKMIVPTGLVDFKYQHTLNVNIFIPRTVETHRLRIPQGQPLAQMIPLTERPVKYEFHLVSKQEMERFALPRVWFLGAYNKHKKAVSCPHMKGNYD